jgi:hypothetical protein
MCQSTDPDGDPLSFSYQFGDGTSDSGPCRIEHVYLASASATICVTDGVAGHEQCRTFAVEVQVPPSPPPPAGGCDGSDRTPPTATLVAPVNNEIVTAATYTIRASAEDAGGSGLARVRFFADQLDGSARFAADDTTAPYEAAWPVPSACGGRFAVSVDAIDNCGNIVSTPAAFVTVNRGCGGRAEVASGRVAWVSQLDVAGGAAQVTVNGFPGGTLGSGRLGGEVAALQGENRVEAVLVRGAGAPGTWRFELGGGVEPGSLRVLEGRPVTLSGTSLAFRVDGRTGERIAFLFRARFCEGPGRPGRGLRSFGPGATGGAPR